MLEKTALCLQQSAKENGMRLLDSGGGGGYDGACLRLRTKEIP